MLKKSLLFCLLVLSACGVGSHSETKDVVAPEGISRIFKDVAYLSNLRLPSGLRICVGHNADDFGVWLDSKCEDNSLVPASRLLTLATAHDVVFGPGENEPIDIWYFKYQGVEVGWWVNGRVALCNDDFDNTCSLDVRGMAPRIALK